MGEMIRISDIEKLYFISRKGETYDMAFIIVFIQKSPAVLYRKDIIFVESVEKVLSRKEDSKRHRGADHRGNKDYHQKAFEIFCHTDGLYIFLIRNKTIT